MEYFWYTSDTIPKGVGYSHFDTLHLTWLAVFVIATVVCSIWYRRAGKKGKSNPLYWFQKNWVSHLWDFPVIIAGIILVMYVCQ